MKTGSAYMNKWLLVLLLLIGGLSARAQMQNGVIVNLAMIDGLELTPSNVFNYQVLNKTGYVRQANVKGVIRYRNSKLQASYTFNTTLQPGNNQFAADRVSGVSWSFSENALRELFFDYGKLPQGTYEYCVTVTLKEINPEKPVDEPVDACIYQTVNDMFLINLVAPENDAKLYEQYPMLSWVVNYPFASALTYKLRVAELKQGQNNENAIVRNNPMLQETNIMSTNKLYPTTAKPLQKFQPYVWTVDAYYKGILLGGAEVWKFTIIEDSLLQELDIQQSYYEFEKHIGETSLNIAGEIKLRYQSDKGNDTIKVKMYTSAREEKSIPDKFIALNNGDNRIVLTFHERASLTHNKNYILELTTSDGKVYEVPFKYLNPLYIK